MFEGMLRNLSWGVNVNIGQSRLMRCSSDRYNAFMNDDIRRPIISGMFYPDSRNQLSKLMDELVGDTSDFEAGRLASSMGLVVPHAGYVYSGSIAAAGFIEAAQYGRPDVVVILGASHTGVGPWFALAPHSAWASPLGQSPVDLDVMTYLINKGFAYDIASFEREHSIEVQLPFTQHLWGLEMPIVPICVSHAPLSQAQDAAQALSRALGERNGLIIASSDFTHYEADSQARSGRDATALDRILDLDTQGFRQLWTGSQSTICGPTAIEILISMASDGLWTNARTVKYATSGDVTGDLSSVVGYASVVMTKENDG